RKARTGEAISNIGSLRGALLRYYQEYDAFPASISLLDIEDPNTRKGAYFSYSFSGTSPDDLVITATGERGIVKNVTVQWDASTGKLTITGLD
ncbi:MAG: hypothetical protein NC821_05560, partial [Candidatus Omnitrophica bacterium]|nr:hypothetical protein [Candidatus Omnitrophota bacterium]